jgi:hypothetical protein
MIHLWVMYCTTGMRFLIYVPILFIVCLKYKKVKCLLLCSLYLWPVFWTTRRKK